MMEGSVLNSLSIHKIALIYHVEPSRAAIAGMPRAAGINFKMSHLTFLHLKNNITHVPLSLFSLSSRL